MLYIANCFYVLTIVNFVCGELFELTYCGCERVVDNELIFEKHCIVHTSAKMSTVGELLAVGEKLGLKEDKLLEFIEKQQRVEAEQDERRKQEEFEREKLASERDERRKQEEFEREKLASEREERAAERELQKLKMELELELERNKHRESQVEIRKSAKAPKLPQFHEDKDDIDAYLERFERYAKAQDWKKEEWATNLSALLGGKALDVYYRMPRDLAGNYKELKSALLKRYNLTEEGFRDKFHHSRAEVGESSQQYMTRIESYLTKWMELAGVEATFEQLRVLVVREQFISSCHKDLSVFLRERKLKTLQEVVIAADTFQEAHGGSLSGYRGSQVNKRSSEHQQKDADRKPYFKDRQPSTTQGGMMRGVPLEDRLCYNCHERGHIAKDCTHPQGFCQRRDDRTCYLCNEKGHIAKNCPSLFNPIEKNKVGCVLHRDEHEQCSTVTRKLDDRTCVHDEERKEISPQTSCSVHTGCSSCTCVCQKKLPVCLVMEMQNVSEDARDVDRDGVKQPICHLLCSKPIPVCSCRNVPTVEGFVNQKKATTMRDTGCSGVVVKCGYVDPAQYTGHYKICLLVDGTTRKVPTAVVHLDSPYYTGDTEAMVMPTPLFDVIVGNIPGARDPESPLEQWRPISELEGKDMVFTQAVTTRQQERKQKQEHNPLEVPDPIKVKDNQAELKQEQKNDATLKKIWGLAEQKEAPKMTKSAQSWFTIKNGLLFRNHQQLHGVNRPVTKQLVVPQGRRHQILKLAHESIMGGHMGVQKTTDRILGVFYWPGVHGDVTRFCRSCDICQRTVPKGRVSKATLEDMPIIDTPFHRIAIDIVGPIYPMSEKKNRYILTVVDYATRYPEAVALPSIETERVAEALLEIYSRVGFPTEVLSDLGTNFTSDLMREVNRLISVQQLTTSPYHPICNGLVEKFNGTLKQILKRLCSEKPRDWDRYLPAVLFAYREVPQESLHFSPFELVYGRSVRGPLEILKTLWTKDIQESEIQTTYNYVIDLRERLERTCDIAHEELRKAQERYKKHYNQTARNRTFQPDDHVLLLLPTEGNKLLMQWKGPFKVVERIGRNDYRIEVKGKIRTFHVNMLKKYLFPERIPESSCSFEDSERSVWEGVAIAVVETEEDSDGIISDEDLLKMPTTGGDETYKDVQYGSTLTPEQKVEAQRLVAEFHDIFTNVPGTTFLGEHKIELTSDEPIRLRPYPLPYSTRQTVSEEIAKMLQADIIEKSDSPYSSPIVLVKKKDGTARFCIDFRKLNKITVFDSEPMPLPDDIFANLEGDEYFSKLDLTKGYWQIPLREEDKKKTAFSTPEGHFQFKKMPFGLVNATATFNRMMRKLLQDIDYTDSFVDDVLGHTPTWQSHLETLRGSFPEAP